MDNNYKNQVSLLLSVLPEIAKEPKFALHGGTAINLFYQNMPRLSVDIDLTYTHFSDDREFDIKEIRSLLEELKERLAKRMSTIRFIDQTHAFEELKLLCSVPGAFIKVEVNQINRGLIGEPLLMTLCENAQQLFDVFCEMQIVSEKQLWGGKIVAALDRQHPRDIFDIRNLLNETGFTNEIMEGFLFFLLCSNRPMHEILRPKLSDQKLLFNNHFIGMTNIPFSYQDFESVRIKMIELIHEKLTINDRHFLLAFAKGDPIWNTNDYSMFPAIKWKLLNILKLKNKNRLKFEKQIETLSNILLG